MVFNGTDEKTDTAKEIDGKLYGNYMFNRQLTAVNGGYITRQLVEDRSILRMSLYAVLMAFYMAFNGAVLCLIAN